MKIEAPGRRILHVDLDPFVVSVERSVDPSLRGRPVIVGGEAGSPGVVAAASDEARSAGVRPGQPLARARRLCPEGVFRPGDLEVLARFSEELTAIFLAASRRVERPSADEAYLDLTPDSPSAPGPVGLAERVKDEIQRRLGLDASLGLASSRLAARVASRFARPRGLLLILPGYEGSFLARQPVSSLPDLPPHLEAGLARAGLDTLGRVSQAEDAALEAAVGAAASHLRQAAAGEGEPPIPLAAPPAFVQEEAVIRARGSDRAALEAVLDGLAQRLARRLRPFGLGAGLLAVDVKHAQGTRRRSESLTPSAFQEEEIARITRSVAAPLLDPPGTVRALQVRLGRLAGPSAQAPLFPPVLGARA